MSKSSQSSSGSSTMQQLQNLLSNVTGSQAQQQQSNQNTTQTGSTSQTAAGTQNQTQTGATTATPNNLASLLQAWGLAGNQVNQTNGNAANTVNQGIDLTGQAANTTGAAATSGIAALLGLGQNAPQNPANAYLTPFANGSVGAANPFISQMTDTISKAIQPQVDGQFGAAGRYGSGANAHAFADTLTRNVGNLAYQNYGDAANRQLQAASQIGTNATNTVGQQIQALLGIPSLGSAATGAGQAAISAGQAPLTNFAQILSALGAGGGTSTTAGQTAGTSTDTQAGTSAQNTSVQDLINAIMNSSQQSSASGTTTGSGTQQGQTNTSGIDLGSLLGKVITPFKLFG